MLKWLIKRIKEQDKRLLLHRIWGFSCGLFFAVLWNADRCPKITFAMVIGLFLYFLIFGESHFFPEKEENKDKESL